MPEKEQKKKKKLNPQQELFCQLYATDREFFGNGVESYLKAYGLKRKQYDSAKVLASGLLTNINILDRVNELMDIALNDIVVDKELAFTIKQKDNLSAKVSAIKEYNQLKQRTANKLEIELKSYEWGEYDNNKGDKKGESDSIQPKSVDQSAS